jgi:dTDP-4-dehydrorhamnose 3,5-epimerase-like enzyme
MLNEVTQTASAIRTTTRIDINNRQLYEQKDETTYTKRTALESDVISNKNNFSTIRVLRGLHSHMPSKHTNLVSAYNAELLLYVSTRETVGVCMCVSTSVQRCTILKVK